MIEQTSTPPAMSQGCFGDEEPSSAGPNMTTSETPQQRKRRRHKLARRLYEALVAQDPNRGITLCDAEGKVIARHDPLPERDAPEIASVVQGPAAAGRDC